MDSVLLSKITITAIRNFPASARSFESLTEFVTSVAKIWFDTKSEQLEFLTNVCSVVEGEGLIVESESPDIIARPATMPAPVIHTQIVYNLVLPPAVPAAPAPAPTAAVAAAAPAPTPTAAVAEAAVAEAAETPVPMAAAHVPETEKEWFTIVEEEKEVEVKEEKQTYASLFPPLPSKPVAAAPAPRKSETAAEFVRRYLMENADQTVTTRDLGRVIRPPKAKDGEAPHMIKWLRSLPFVDILGHSDFGGNIIKLRTPGANWYMLDSKQHIAGPYTLADIKKQCAGAPKKIRHGNSGKFQMSTEFAMTA